MSFLETAFFPSILMVILVALVGAMVVIISQLYRNFMAPEYCLELIMRFAQDEFDTLHYQAKGSMEAVSFSRIGAVEYFGKKHMLTKQQRQILAIKVLHSKLQLSAKELSHYYAKAVSDKSHAERYRVVVRGVKAAKQWLNYQSGIKKFTASSRLKRGALLAF